MRADVLSKRLFLAGCFGLPWLWCVHVMYWYSKERANKARGEASSAAATAAAANPDQEQEEDNVEGLLSADSEGTFVYAWCMLGKICCCCCCCCRSDSIQVRYSRFFYYNYSIPQIIPTNLVIPRKYHWKRKSGSDDRFWEASWRAWHGSHGLSFFKFWEILWTQIGLFEDRMKPTLLDGKREAESGWLTN